MKGKFQLPSKLRVKQLSLSRIANSEDSEDQTSNEMAFLVGGFVAVGGFMYGYDTGLINSIRDMEYVRHQFAGDHVEFTTKENSILTAILSVGTFFGAVFAPLLSDTLGRKFAIMIASFLVFVVGNICQIVSTRLKLFCIGRLITGLSIGIISVVVPLYQAESSPKKIRGAVISTYQWAITWGLLVSSAVSQGTHAKNSPLSYRLPIGLQFVWSIFLGMGMIYLPESPRFFVMKDDLEKAANSLARLRRMEPDDPRLIEELIEIKASHDYENSFGEYSIADCFTSDPSRPKQLKRILTGVAIQALQQCSGINFIFYYGINFFSKTGVSKSYIISLITYAVNVAFTIPGIILVERIGRRKILIFGGLIMGIANLIIGIVGVTTDSVVANKIMIAFVCLFIAAFAGSWAPVVWVYCGEIFPLSVRGQSVSITAATNWIVNFVFSYTTPYLIDTGAHTTALGTKIFFMWGGFNIIGVIIVYLTVYETKGLSLEQIDELYRSCPNAISSSKFKVKLSSGGGGAEEDINELVELKDLSNNTEKPDESHDSYNDTTTDYFDPNYEVDLGYGMSLAGQNRGPPSLASASSIETENNGASSSNNISNHITKEDSNDIATSTTYGSLSEYVSHLSNQNTHSHFDDPLEEEEEEEENLRDDLVHNRVDEELTDEQPINSC